MMNDKPPTREMCLKMAEMLFSDLFIKQAEELENITARQKTWLRAIFNFKLI